MRFVAPISEAIWTIQIPIPWFSWRVETVPASLVSPNMLLRHTVGFLASFTAVLWLLQDAKEWVICGGWGTVDMCHVDVHDQTLWQGDFINPGTLRLLKLMSFAFVYCYPVLAHIGVQTGWVGFDEDVDLGLRQWGRNNNFNMLF